MSEFIEELDLEGYDAEGIEKPDGVPAGWYRAVVEDVSKDAQTGALILRFKVTDGEHAGQKIDERLWDPKRSGDAAKADVSRKRRALFAKRLRLLGDNDFGKQVTLDWWNAVGKACAIQVKERKYKDKDNNEKIARNIDFGGVYPLDDQRVPEEIRGAATPTNGGGATTTGGTNATNAAGGTNSSAGKRPADSEFDDI